jgi:hypothetical protein
MRFRVVNAVEKSGISCGFVAACGVSVDCWMDFKLLFARA